VVDRQANRRAARIPFEGSGDRDSERGTVEQEAARDYGITTTLHTALCK